MPDISPEMAARLSEADKRIMFQARREAFPSGFIYCSDCGSKLSIETMYCPKCAKEVSQIPMVKDIERKAFGER